MGNINRLRHSFNVVGMIIVLCLSLCSFSSAALTIAAERFDAYLPHLHNQRVGLVVNHTSLVGETHLVDALLAKNINVVAVFAPEHGFRGDKGAGEKVANAKDPATGLPLISLYGKNKKPTPKMVENIDVLLFDIQDVGLRFYTYISTMHYAMEAAAENDKTFIVLDRPNPNGRFIAGPVLDMQYQSFVGMHPIPVMHGLTVAELANMIKGEAWINNAANLNLLTIPMGTYHKQMPYTLPVPPSPNLPNAEAIRLYASLCLFEPTEVSVGRGTLLPFQMLGHNHVQLGAERITPISMPKSAPNPKFKDTPIWMADLRSKDTEGFDLTLLTNTYAKFMEQQRTFFTSESFFDKLAGNGELRQQLMNGEKLSVIEASWQPGLKAYKELRAPYLLYPEQ